MAAAARTRFMRAEPWLGRGRRALGLCVCTLLDLVTVHTLKTMHHIDTLYTAVQGVSRYRRDSYTILEVKQDV